MLDSTIETLHAELSTRYPSSGSYSRSDIESSDLPEIVSSCLLADLRRAAARELQGHHPARFKWVDGENSDVEARFAAFSEAVLEQARVPADEWNFLIMRAVTAVVNAAASPREALVDHVFGAREPILQKDEVVSRVLGFAAHDDLRDAIVDSLSRRDVENLTPARFGSIVEKVDDLRTDGFGPEEWLEELKPVYALLEALQVEPKLPAGDIGTFLSARGCEAEARCFSRSEAKHLTLSEAKSLLGSATEDVEKGEFGALLTFFDSANNKADVPKGKDDDDDAVPLWKRFQKNLNAPMGSQGQHQVQRTRAEAAKPERPKPRATAKSKPVPPAGARPVARKGSDKAVNTQQPLWQQYHSGGAASQAGMPNPRELELSVLGEEAARHRNAFITELFQGKEESYLEILLELSRAGNWSEASRVIAEDVFKKYKVNIYSEPAVTFTNAVEARYRRRSVGA